jgi:hypothetical protein
METGACMRLPFALELCTGTNGFAEKLHHPRIWSIRKSLAFAQHPRKLPPIPPPHTMVALHVPTMRTFRPPGK